MRRVRTRVFPEPAPAITSTGPSVSGRPPAAPDSGLRGTSPASSRPRSIVAGRRRRNRLRSRDALALMIEGQEGVTWEDWCALADACEEHGVETLFRSDHYISQCDEADNVAHDAWTTIAALAARTTTLRFGTLVSPATFRAARPARERGRDRRPRLRRARSSSGSAPAGWSASTARTASRSPRRATRLEMLRRAARDRPPALDGGARRLPRPPLHARGRARTAEAGAAAAPAAHRRRQRQARHRRAGAALRRRVQHAVRLARRGAREIAREDAGRCRFSTS